MGRNVFGWWYPPGAANDPNAPYNQTDDPDWEDYLSVDIQSVSGLKDSVEGLLGDFELTKAERDCIASVSLDDYTGPNESMEWPLPRAFIDWRDGKISELMGCRGAV